jgi:hypothetical protein
MAKILKKQLEEKINKTVDPDFFDKTFESKYKSFMIKY